MALTVCSAFIDVGSVIGPTRESIGDYIQSPRLVLHREIVLCEEGQPSRHAPAEVGAAYRCAQRRMICEDRERLRVSQEINTELASAYFMARSSCHERGNRYPAGFS